MFPDAHEREIKQQQLSHEDKVALLFEEGTTLKIPSQTAWAGFGPIGAASTAAASGEDDFLPTKLKPTDVATWVRVDELMQDHCAPVAPADPSCVRSGVRRDCRQKLSQRVQTR